MEMQDSIEARKALFKAVCKIRATLSKIEGLVGSENYVLEKDIMNLVFKELWKLGHDTWYELEEFRIP